MRHLALAALLTPILGALSGCADPSKAQSPPPRLTVDGLHVLTAIGPSGHLQVQGKFIIRTAAQGERSIPASGSGGACLIASFKGVDHQCWEDSDCNHMTAGIIPHEWHGYCVYGRIHEASLKGVCFVKPSDNYCLKGPQVGVGTHYTPLVDTTEVSKEAKRYSNEPVGWAVLGCVNGVYDTARETPPPCGAAEKLYNIGGWRTIRQ